MINASWLRVGRLPIRARLTLAYLLALALILVIFAMFIYTRVQRDLYSQVDTALEVAAIQAVAVIDHEEHPLTFEDVRLSSDFLRRLDDFSIYLLDTAGTQRDSIGAVRPNHPFPISPNYRTIQFEGDNWRIYSEPIYAADQQLTGWVQVAQTLDDVDSTLAALRFQFLIGIPLALLLAGASGIFLARQSMEPINQITRTAQSIHETDLARRINYDGPADEVGRLAETFDEMLNRLQSAFERQLRFTSDAAHELRTPLGALKARIDVILNQQRTPGEYKAALQDMDGQVNRLIRLTQGLLFMARLDQQPSEISQGVIEFDEFIDGILEQFVLLAAEKNISLQNQSPHPVSFVGDTDLLIRLFLNLLDNAIKYTHTGGDVTIRALANQTTVSISIQDNGPGIALDHLPHLFDRFYQIESSRARSADMNPMERDWVWLSPTKLPASTAEGCLLKAGLGGVPSLLSNFQLVSIRNAQINPRPMASYRTRIAPSNCRTVG